MQKEDLLKLKDEQVLSYSVAHPDAFSILVDRYEEPLLRKAKQLVGADDAEDVLQEAFVKIYMNAGRFRVVPGASFKSWAYKILFNTSFTWLKKRKRDRAMTIELEPEVYEVLPDNDNTFERKLLLDEVLSVLSKLPNAAAEILELYFVKGKSEQDIALLKELSVGAVRTRIHRAKKEFNRVHLDIDSQK